MIRTFADKETRRIFEREVSKKLPREIQYRARIKLELINAAGKLDDLRVPPSNRLEKLKGERLGTYSIRINDQYRICFSWKVGDAYDVEIIDYH